MQKATLIALVATVATANKKYISHEMTGRIRDAHPGWVAHEPETNPLRNLSNEELLNLVSGAMTGEPRFESIQDQTPSVGLPDSWDPRTDDRTKKCIHPIRDQQQCGSCWAFGATEALSDRFCLAGQDVILSPQDMVSCDYNNYGCNGGYMNLAWLYLRQTGVVSEACFPYTSGSGFAPGCPSP
jgi:C1A family cysteine protease